MSIPVFLSNCSPNEMTGIAEAKNIYVVGAKILKRTSKFFVTNNHVEIDQQRRPKMQRIYASVNKMAITSNHAQQDFV
jgi:hypothetical protein